MRETPAPGQCERPLTSGAIGQARIGDGAIGSTPASGAGNLGSSPGPRANPHFSANSSEAPGIPGVREVKSQEAPPPRRLGYGRLLLALGIALRIVVFWFLDPLNNDVGHLDVVKYIVEHHALPAATASFESYQPPLYYLLAAPVYAATGSVKWVQLLSLVFSILTLLVIYRLLYVDKLLADLRSCRYAFLMACFLPQFVMFDLYLSNDNLAILIGAMVVFQVVRFVAAPTIWQAVLLAVLVSLGLLTKATFLAFLPALFVLVAFVFLRQGHSARMALIAALALSVLAAGLGSWRYVQSYREARNPFVSNLDSGHPWVIAQQSSYRGAVSFFDVNLWKLLRSPSVSPQTQGAYPLLLYGTFWYQHIPESNFYGSSSAPYYYLGSVIYVLALAPSLVFFYGLFLLAERLPRFVISCDLSRQDDQRLLAGFVAVLFLLGNLALIVAVALKYHVWTLMQGRLLFPSFCGLLVAFGTGASALADGRTASAVLKAAMVALLACFFLYFASEISNQIFGWPRF
jgi:4-amino-4-deoxy-L-arabinose transferase-like glycosyltransferase